MYGAIIKNISLNQQITKIYSSLLLFHGTIEAMQEESVTMHGFRTSNTH